MAPSGLHRVLSRRAAILGVAALGVVLLGAGATPWLRVEAVTAISREVLGVRGSQAVPMVPAAGLVLLAAALALALAGRVGRLLAAGAIVVAGVAAAGATLGFLAEPAAAARTAVASATGVRPLDVDPDVTLWPGAVVAGGLLAVGAGAIVVRGSRTWPGRSGQRYERVGPTSPEPGLGGFAPDTQSSGGSRAGRDPGPRAMRDWDALSRGEDPS